MTVKSDKWIRQQCKLPTFMLTACKHVQNPDPLRHTHGPKYEYPTDKSSDEILAMMKFDRGIADYRKLTEEEIAAFVPMISPFEPNQVRVEKAVHPLAKSGISMGVHSTDPKDVFGTVVKKVISYGTSSFGYDVRLDDEFKIFTNINSTMIDPLNFDHKSYIDQKGEFCIIPPNSYILGRTIETFKIPRDVMVLCVGKSTYARCGAIVNVTPIEAGFEGRVVIEISNATSLPLKVYANQGIAQFIFFQSDEECDVSYADRDGKYQNQSIVQTALP